MRKFRVNEKCIGCQACARVAENNFEIVDKKAIIIKQPDNEQEFNESVKAIEACPTDAIEYQDRQVILGESNVRETMEQYPFLKYDLLELSEKFKTMQKPIMWNTMARFATFNDTAKMTGLSICEILHFINKKLDLEAELNEAFPQCIRESQVDLAEQKKIHWEENQFFLIENQMDLEKAIERIGDLSSGQAIVFESELPLIPLEKYLNQESYEYYMKTIERGKTRLSIYRGQTQEVNILDVRKMTEDPFDVIIKEAYNAKVEEQFMLVQTFKPLPLINMLSSMGFDHEVIIEEADEVRVLFTKQIEEESQSEESDMPSLMIQSATPVGYPIIMKLLQSSRLKEVMKIKELKVWDETEKHLGWIVNGKADISFSAVITASKFKNSKVKMPVVFVWDNFTLLSRNADVKEFSDLKGEEIVIPLFEDAPPAKITKYLIESRGLEYSDFQFKYGKPFGRPKEIMADFITGKAQHVLLREPEASFAIEAIKKQEIDYSEIDYSDIWNQANRGFGIFPNAGVIVKEELYEQYPEVMAVFEEELEDAIDWVNENKKEAAKLSFDMMRNSSDNVEAFINRVTFKSMSGDELVDKIEDFYQILSNNNILNIDVDDELMKIFKI
jgi:NitT/TauT family transport system substrate-binding protein